MDYVERFEAERPYLMAIAYRMLGAVMEAEDILQEAFLRWREVTGPVKSTRAYLTTIVTRLCIDYLRTARVQREQYIGPWLPEPLLTDARPGPDSQAQLADSLSMAFLIVLETLQPVERAVFLLREVFGYDYAGIAAIVDKSEANCRQIASRARRAVNRRQPRAEATGSAPTAVVEQFLTTLRDGDLAGLINLLADDVVWHSDGGGLPGIARKPVRGAAAVARFIAGLAQQAPPGMIFQPAEVNGGPGLILYTNGRLQLVLAFAATETAIQTIYAIVNPAKLSHIAN